jgi:hypothetical protein
MKVHPSHTGEVASTHAYGQGVAQFASTAADTKPASSSRSFAEMLATRSAPTTVSDKDVSTSAVKLRKGESMKAVEGHSYAEISGGKRDGLFVNTTSNKRRGQAFVLVQKHGREYHIYGTGKHRLVVALRKRDDAGETQKTPTTPAATTAPNTTSSTGGVTPTVSAS